MLGRTLGHYRIEGELGAGSMGIVYRARDERLERTVALKVLTARAVADELSRKRFRKEALALSQLNHPNIATVFDFDRDGDTDFLVLEYINGETLAQRLSISRLSEEETVRFGTQIAEGLAAAHERGVLHRDLKPGNLQITQRGWLKILDFGLAILREQRTENEATATMTETIVAGTPAYMPPEQFNAGSVDPRSDVYSAGAVLYEMATGRRAFPQSSYPELMVGILQQMPTPVRSLNPEISPALESIIWKCLQKDPERRYQSANELIESLGRLTTPGSGGHAPPSQRWFLAGGAAILALLLIAALWFFPHGSAAGIESLAVLPLDNLSGDASQDYFAEGMTEVLITDLGKIGSLRVISRPSVMRYKGSHAALSAIAGELKVDALIVGSVARSGSRVRITTQLYHAAKDRQLWAESYERDLRDILALQGEVAHTISGEIKIKVTAQERLRLAKSRPINPEAYDSYLRGAFLYARHSIADNQAAIAATEKALALDPSLSAGHALLALAYVERFFTFVPQEHKELEEKAYVAVERSVSLDPDEPMAYFARGRLLWTPSNRFPHEKAIQEYRHALNLNPNLADVRAQLSLTYNHVGLLDEAMREARKAADINPADTLPRVVVGQALLYQGQYEKALNVWMNNPQEAYASVTGSHTTWTLFQMGRTREAAEKIGDFLKTYPKDVGGLGVQAVLLAAAGENRKAEAVIQQIAPQKGFGHFHHTAYYIACAYARMNQIDAAIQWVREAAESGFACLPLFERDPNLQPLRQDPRWITMMTQMKEQWNRYKKIAAEL